ncbi:hypothetical protein V5799_008846 [Amblyomma americanum]|uniref:Secreted protein n=1 Tax=Amblyomma americanum TaxID=6943 RepID=A0AAQ4FC95_AMBAM
MPRALNFGTVGALAGFLIVNVLDRFDSTGETAAARCIVGKQTKREPQGSPSPLNFHAFLVADNGKRTGSKLVTEEFWDQETKRNFCEASDCLKNEECREKKLFCPFNIGKSLARSRSDDSAANQDGDSYKKRLNDVMKGFDGFQKAFKCAVTKDECNLLPPAIRR